MSAALVPGLIRREAPWSTEAFSESVAASWPGTPGEGDLGPIWTSGKGGGLGSRGELAGEMWP